jgi:glycosyltransferase involved in cell wall biosynthesis
MFGNLSGYKMRFLIVSDTAMFISGGKNFAFGPVVREMETYHHLFNDIIWIGFERNETKDLAIMSVVPDYVRCIMLPSTGGDKMFDKLLVLIKAPYYAAIILYFVFKSNIIHTRAPSVPAFLALLYSFAFRYKTWWHKYAGNWWEVNPPFFYGLQRRVLRLASHTKVTVNGKNIDQPAHCISFENPCITTKERLVGMQAVINKKFNKSFNLCFVGRIEAEKGIRHLINALSKIDKNWINELHIVGVGPLASDLPVLLKSAGYSFYYHGSMNRDDLNKLFTKCHFIVLPTTASEGFPKVLAEAANFGCIPIVTNISGIGMYLFDRINSFTFNQEELYPNKLHEILIESFECNTLHEISNKAYESVQCFTFENFSYRLQNEIIKIK